MSLMETIELEQLANPASGRAAYDLAETTSQSHFVQKLFSLAGSFVHVVPILIAIVIIGCLQ